MGPEAGVAIGEMLKTNTSLKKLDLYVTHKSNKIAIFFNSGFMTKNKIGNKGAKIIEEALKTNSTLTEIDLRSFENNKYINGK